MSHRSVLLALPLCFTVAFAALPAAAQDTYPNRPIKLVVPYTAGGGVDTVARLVGERMSKTLGQPVVVDNKPGGERHARRRHGGQGGT